MTAERYLDGSVSQFREHLIQTLVDFGRSREGATRQVADFEHAVRMAAIADTAKQAQVRAHREHRGRGGRAR